MTVLSDFRLTLRDWVSDDDVPDAVIDSWVLMLEERCNNELRHFDMIQRDRAPLTDQCVTLHDDWLEFVYVRYPNRRPLDYVTPNEYWLTRFASRYSPIVGASNAVVAGPGIPGAEFVVQPTDWASTGLPPTSRQAYTIIGRTLFVHGDVDPTLGTEIEIAYYAELPSLAAAGDTPPLMFRKHPKLYLYGSLAQSAPYLVEDDRAQVWDANATALIETLNGASKTGRISGSPIRQRVRGFG